MTTIVSNWERREFFFSKKHSTPSCLGPAWVPVTCNTKSREAVLITETNSGFTEIKNPEPELQA